LELLTRHIKATPSGLPGRQASFVQRVWVAPNGRLGPPPKASPAEISVCLFSCPTKPAPNAKAAAGSVRTEMFEKYGKVKQNDKNQQTANKNI
jgi:hypothetical protein